MTFGPACLVLAGASLLAAPAPAPRIEEIRLDVPAIAQTPEHCGPASLAMVLRLYGAAGSLALVVWRRAL